MLSSTNMDPNDIECLSWVAVGRSELVPEAVVERLLVAGLVFRIAPIAGGPLALELTRAGLALIRSSDQ